MSRGTAIAILTGGGDCPGINAVIRAVAKKAMLELGAEVFGIEDGFEGLVTPKWRPLRYEDVSGILTLGGTILGTSNKCNPYRLAEGQGEALRFVDASRTAIANIERLGVDCLVCIGGDGTLRAATSIVDTVAKQARLRSVTLEREFVRGTPRSALAEQAEKADLVVVGARGHGAVGAALLGSVSTWLLHHLHRPVAVVPLIS